MDEAAALQVIDAALIALPRINDAPAVESFLEATQDALAALAVTTNAEARGKAHFVLGMLYEQRRPGSKADNLERAIHHLTEALTASPATESNIGMRGMILHNLGLVYKNRVGGSHAENLEQAISYLETALAEESRDEHPASWATTASQLASTYHERVLGDHAASTERALDLYGQALALRPREKQAVEWAITMHNIGAALLDRPLGERRANLLDGRKHLEAALEVRTERELPEHFALTQSLLAECLIKLSKLDAENADADLDAALDCLQAVSRVWTLERARLRWLQTQLRLAQTYARRGQGQAIAVLQQVMLTASPVTESNELTMARGTLVPLLLNRGGAGDLDRAIAEAEQAVAAYVRAGDMRNLAQAAELLGRALAAAERWDDSARAYEQALQAEGDVSESALSLTTELAHLLSVSGLHEAAAYAFARSSRHRWADVLVVLERGRTRVLGDTLARARADLAELDRRGDRAIAAKQRFLAADQVWRELMEAEVSGGAFGGRPLSPEEFSQRQRAQSELRNARDSIRSVEGFAGFMREPDIDTVLAAATRRCPLVYLFTAEHGGYVVAVYRDALDQPGIMSADLRLTSRDVDRMLFPQQEENGLWPGLLGAQRLGKDAVNGVLDTVLPYLGATVAIPIGGLLRKVGATEAAIVPCGRLGALPLAAAQLVAKPPPGAPAVSQSRTTSVLDYFTLRIAPSARVAVSSAVPARGGRRYAAIANPRPASGDLVWAAAEVRLAARQTGAVAPLVGAAASRSAVASAVSGADVVHFACHGVFDLVAPERSRLELADGDLTMPEIMASRMLGGVRLVVASACETAASDLRMADEFTGMPAAFLQAGAGAALGTLWPVSDLSASLLVSRVAAACCDPAADPAVELARAQAWLRDLDAGSAADAARELIAGADGGDVDRMLDHVAWLELRGDEHPFREPSHWAPYVLVGGLAKS